MEIKLHQIKEKSKSMILIGYTMAFALRNRIILFVLMVFSLILIGSLGYLIIRIYVEHHSATLTDAIYFSVATISTLGYYPPNSMLTSEVGKWFHIFYLGLGLAIIFGGIQTIIGPWFEMKIKMAERGWRVPIPKDAHVIICGYNEFALYIAEKLKMLGIPYVVVDNHAPDDMPHVEGDCTEISTIKKANVLRATALIALMDDMKNAMISLTARSITEDLNIIAIATTESGEEIIKKSGANTVIPRNKIIGKTIQYWSSGDYKYDIFASVERLKISEKMVKGKMTGKKISELRFREKYGTIIAIYRNGKMITDPSPNFTLKSGDVIIYLPSEVEAS